LPIENCSILSEYLMPPSKYYDVFASTQEQLHLQLY
jgi:hypothetical protein